MSKMVEPLDMAQQAREYARNRTVSKIMVRKRTLEIAYKAMEDMFLKSNDLEEILDIMEAAKDIGFEALVEKIIDFMGENSDRRKVYQDYKNGLLSDHSGASDQDNR